MRIRTPNTPGLNLLIYPSPLAGPGRVSKIAQSLHSTGRFTSTQIIGIDSTDLPTRQALAHRVELLRIRGANLKDRFGALRILTLWQARVYRHFRRKNLSAVAAQNLFVLPLAYALARRSGAIFAYNAHELETETIASRGLRQKIQRIIERRYIYKADVVSVVNEPIAQWYRNTYPGICPVVVTNAPVDSRESVDLRTRLGIPDDALLYMHVGFLTSGRSIPLILEVFSRHPKAHIVFLGDGSMRPQVERAAQDFPNIHWLPPVAPEEVVAHLRGADIGICLIEHSCLSMTLSTPNKLMEALAAGIPPLCSDLVEARRLLSECAHTWVLHDPDSQLDSAISRITRADVERFTANPPRIPTWEEQACALVDSYVSALDSRTDH